MTTVRAVVIDMDSASRPGERYDIVATLDSVEAAEEWIDRQDPAKVQRGGFGLDVSELCGDCGEFHSPEAECDS